jgi:hypothetical protein
MVSRVENVLRPLTAADNPALKIKPWRAHMQADNEMLLRRAKRNVRLVGDRLLKEQEKKAKEAAKITSKGPTAPPGTQEEQKEKKDGKAKAKAKGKGKP